MTPINPRHSLVTLLAGLVMLSPLLAMSSVAEQKHQRAFRVLIVADMEGLSGIDDPRMTSSSPPHASYYARGLTFLHQDVNACIAGLFDAGASAVDVADGHGNGHNLRAAVLDSRAKLLSQNVGRDLYFELPKEGKYDAVLVVGMHEKPLSGGFIDDTRG